MQKINDKLQWQKPTVKELDIEKTMGGSAPFPGEGPWESQETGESVLGIGS